MKLTECANCGFYIQPNEKFCPDCGISEPTVALESIAVKIENQVIIKTVGIFAAAVLIGLILYRLNGSYADFGDWFRLELTVLLIATVISVLVVLLNARRSASASERQRFVNAENGESLQFMQDICLMRNHALNEKRREFGGAARHGIRRSDGEITIEERQAARQVSRLLERYDLFLNRIFLARLQNELLPLSGNRNELNDADFFGDLDGISQEVETLGAGVAEDFGGEVSESYTTEKQLFLAATEKIEAFCAALVDRRKNPARLDAPFAAPIAEDFTNQSEILNARQTLSEILQSFNKLEREFKQLKIQR